MAHIAKYKAASCGHMLAHYRRDESSLGRENIDPTRTKDNYTLGLDDRDGKVGAMDGIEPNWATVEGRIEGVNKAAKAAGKRAVRKDAVVMADVVVTLPENVRKGDEFKFFGYTYWFLIQKLGKENMMGGFVHRDEVRKDGSPVRDHMHVRSRRYSTGASTTRRCARARFTRPCTGSWGTIWKNAWAIDPRSSWGTRPAR